MKLNKMKLNKMKLNNWFVTSNQNGFLAPELVEYYLKGEVEDNPKFTDGEIVRTSPIKACKGRTVTTKNSTYTLGKIDKGYRKYLKSIRPNWDYRNPIIVLDNHPGMG